MKLCSFLLLLVLLTFSYGLCSECKAEDTVVLKQTPPMFFSSPIDAKPLKVGDVVPSVVLRTVTGQSFNLTEAILKKPTVLIFYRGGWCPYCNTHLGQLASIEPELRELGYQIIAISPDRPEKLQESVKKHTLKYLLLSDSTMSAASKFGIAFKVDDATVALYKSEYKIDLEADSGETHHLLPVPSAFVVGKDRVIKFVYVNADYKVRVKPQELMKAARNATISR